MTSLLKQAFDNASKLPANTQDELAQELLNDLESELRWQTVCETSQDKLEKLAEEALKEFKSGKAKQWASMNCDLLPH